MPTLGAVTDRKGQVMIQMGVKRSRNAGFQPSAVTGGGVLQTESAVHDHDPLVTDQIDKIRRADQGGGEGLILRVFGIPVIHRSF